MKDCDRGSCCVGVYFLEEGRWLNLQSGLRKGAEGEASDSA